MLTENQEIIYKKKTDSGYDELFRLTSENLEKLELSIAAYIRHYQPFTKKGDQLTIPKESGGIITTSRIKGVKRKKNSLIINTHNSVYEVEYRGIALEKILNDGVFEGVNAEKAGDSICLFPCLEAI